MISVAIIVLVLVIVSGTIYVLNFENKKMRNNQTQNVIEVSGEKTNPAFHLFLYLVSFLSLGFLVAGILISIQQAINKFIPDSLDNNSYFDNDAIKFGLSSLIVTIPLYYGVLFLLNKKLERNEIPTGSLVRKVITYLALVAFSGMAIGSLVAIMYNYFDGELTARFVLKALSFFLVSLFFFGFYFWEIRREKFTRNPFMILFLTSIGIAITSLILGFFVIDSPRTARAKRIDNETIANIQTASRKINQKFKGQNEFGDNITTRQTQRDRMILEMSNSGKSLKEIEEFVNKFYGEPEKKSLPMAEDMQSQIDKDIIYKPGEGSIYELCGTFEIESERGGSRWYTNNGKWAHPAGRHCFKFDANSGEYDIEPITIKAN